MKKMFFAASLAIVGLTTLAFTTTKEKETAATTYTVSAEKSKIEWFQGKPTGAYHEGTIGIKSGSIETGADGKITGGKFVIDLTSITSDNQMLTEHLKDDQHGVLVVSKFKEATFTITKVTYAADAKKFDAPEITGDFDLKGVKTPVTFKAAVPKVGDTFFGQAYFTLDFTKWGIQLAPATQLKINLFGTK